MTVVLGIDAAWTANQSSGVAVVAKKHGKWRALRVAPSYEAFTASVHNGPVDWTGGRFRGSEPWIPEPLSATST